MYHGPRSSHAGGGIYIPVYHGPGQSRPPCGAPSQMMVKRDRGRHSRRGISLIEAAQHFSDDARAEAWLIALRWPNGIRCPKCDSDAISPKTSPRRTPQYHCAACKSNFTVRTGTIIHHSRLPLSRWALAFYLHRTRLKDVSSMELHRQLGITQKSAWHLARRIRETWNQESERMAGAVETDETFIGGKESTDVSAGRGTGGRTPVAGIPAADRRARIDPPAPLARVKDSEPDPHERRARIDPPAPLARVKDSEPDPHEQ